MKYDSIYLSSYKLIFTVNKKISKQNIVQFLLLICQYIISYGGLVRFPNTFYWIMLWL